MGSMVDATELKACPTLYHTDGPNWTLENSCIVDTEHDV